MSVDIDNKTIKSEIFITKEDAGKASANWWTLWVYR